MYLFISVREYLFSSVTAAAYVLNKNSISMSSSSPSSSKTLWSSSWAGGSVLHDWFLISLLTFVNESVYNFCGGPKSTWKTNITLSSILEQSILLSGSTTIIPNKNVKSNYWKEVTTPHKIRQLAAWNISDTYLRGLTISFIISN